MSNISFSFFFSFPLLNLLKNRGHSDFSLGETNERNNGIITVSGMATMMKGGKINWGPGMTTGVFAKKKMLQNGNVEE